MLNNNDDYNSWRDVLFRTVCSGRIQIKSLKKLDPDPTKIPGSAALMQRMSRRMKILEKSMLSIQFIRVFVTVISICSKVFVCTFCLIFITNVVKFLISAIVSTNHSDRICEKDALLKQTSTTGRIQYPIIDIKYFIP